MKVTPALRRAVHQAADLILDALAEDAREEVKPSRRRGQVVPKKIEMPALPPEKLGELEAQLETQLAKAGYRKV